MGKVVRIVRDTVTNADGKVISDVTKENVVSIRKMEDEPAYIKLYIDDLGKVLGLQDGHRKILILVAASVDYEGIVSIAIGRKARIAATLDCSVKTVDNAVGEFTKQGILKRIGRGEYELNPNLFAKGAWRDIRERRQSFVMTVHYTHEGRKVKTRAMTKAESENDTAQQQMEF
jgi:predicted transcriptional regulator